MFYARGLSSITTKGQKWLLIKLWYSFHPDLYNTAFTNSFKIGRQVFAFAVVQVNINVMQTCNLHITGILGTFVSLGGSCHLWNHIPLPQTDANLLHSHMRQHTPWTSALILIVLHAVCRLNQLIVDMHQPCKTKHLEFSRRFLVTKKLA